MYQNLVGSIYGKSSGINREHIILDFITSRDKETSHKLRLDIMVIATTNYADIDLIEYVQKDVTRDIGGTWRYT